MLFLGYDPGGGGTHGVAAVDIAADGALGDIIACDALNDADAVKKWLERYPDAVALGIDTLLGWSGSGSRRCDRLLRAAYPAFRNTIIAQNALYSSMTLNGAIVARAATKRGLPLYESHPKLFVKIKGAGDIAAASILRAHASLKAGHRPGSKSAKVADDKADALLAAWCAAQGFLGRWQIDLFASAGDDLEFFTGSPVYPWPENPIAHLDRLPRVEVRHGRS